MTNEERLRNQAISTIGFLLALFISVFFMHKFYIYSITSREELTTLRYGKESSVVLFNIDYDAYGQLNGSTLQVRISNVRNNKFKCHVYIVNEDGEELTDKYPLEVGDSISEMEVNSKYEKGKDVYLIYQVHASGLHSNIKCTYNIQEIIPKEE